MRASTRRRVNGGRVLLYAFLASLVLVFALPLLWAVSSSFKQRGDIFGYPPDLVPAPATLDNYRGLLDGQRNRPQRRANRSP